MPDDDRIESTSTDDARDEPEPAVGAASESDGEAESDGEVESDGVAESDGAGESKGEAADAGESDDAERSVPDPRDGLSDPRDNVPPAEAPSVSPPEVGVEGPDLPSPDEVPEDLRAEFWELVIAFNVALFALALGAMLVVLQSNRTAGAISLTVGTIALAYGLHQYRTREHTP